MGSQVGPGGVVALAPARLNEAVEVLVAAFMDDPILRYIFLDQGVLLADALRALFHFSCVVRFDLGWPLLGVEMDGRLAGVLGVTEVEDVPWPASLAEEYGRFLAAIGPTAAARFERYPALADPHRPAVPNYSVGVIGVLPSCHGRGLGRRLLETVHRLSADHPTSTGVYLDTENPASKAFYEHCGYRCIASERLDDTIDIWCMFRQDDPA